MSAEVADVIAAIVRNAWLGELDGAEAMADEAAAIAQDILRKLADAQRGPLRALLDALDRGRCLFWTGNVLVELNRDFDPAEEGVGGVTMVLDDEDFAALKSLAARDDTSAQAERPSESELHDCPRHESECATSWDYGTGIACTRSGEHDGFHVTHVAGRPIAYWRDGDDEPTMLTRTPQDVLDSDGVRRPRLALNDNQAAIKIIISVDSRVNAEERAERIQELLYEHMPELHAAVAVELPAERPQETT